MDTVLWWFEWESILFSTSSSRRLFLAPGEEVTSLFDLVFIIGLSVRRGGKKTMLMRSGVQCPRGSVSFPLFFGQEVCIIWPWPATMMTTDWERVWERGWLVLFFLRCITTPSSCPFAAKSARLNDCLFRISKENERCSSTMGLRRLKLQDQCSQWGHQLGHLC